MREKIEIEDDRVRLLRLTPAGIWETEVDLALQHFLEVIASEMPSSYERHPILPHGCRWYGHRNQREVLILEDSPATRLIRFAARTRKQGDEAPEESYELAFPYLIYAFFFVGKEFEEMKVFYRSAPLTSMKDPLHLCNLYNVQLSRGHRAHNRACLRPKPDIRNLFLNEQVQRLIDHFWNTEFNLDIEDSGFGFYAERDSRLASLAAWEEAGREDPLFALQFPWEPAGMTLLELIGFFMSQRVGGVRSGPLSARDLSDLCYALADSKREHPVFDHRNDVWRQ